MMAAAGAPPVLDAAAPLPHPASSVSRTLLALAALLCSAHLPSAAAEPESTPTDPYPLDSIERSIKASAAVRCSPQGLVRYQGEAIAYASAVQVRPAFRERLAQFERLAASVAREIYGRPPRKLLHVGAFNCRRIRAYPDLLSEHALGNAIDIAGFEFGPGQRGDAPPPARAPRAAFTVRMSSHWDPRRPADQVHSDFLRTLARRVIAAPALFRVALGPAWPGHRDHFHFDCAPYRLVAIF